MKEITSDVQTLQKELDKYINIIQENIVNELYAQIKNDIKEKASSSQYIRNGDNKLITGTINAISSSHIDNSFLSKIYPKKDVLFKKYPYARCYKDSDNDYGIEFENYIIDRKMNSQKKLLSKYYNHKFQCSLSSFAKIILNKLKSKASLDNIILEPVISIYHYDLGRNYIKENETFEFELYKDNPNLIPSFAIKYKYLY